MFTVFDMYFAGIVSIQYHPRNPPEERMTLEECAQVAVDMLAIRQFVLEENKWPGVQ